MLLTIDRHSGVPAYRQLMDQIRFHVTGGLLDAGDELPSTRQLAGELGLNPMTVSKAFSFLEKEGVVERRPGMPLVVAAGDDGAHAARRVDEVRRHLAPAATALRQLGVEPDEALRVLRALLDGNEGKDGDEGKKS